MGEDYLREFLMSTFLNALEGLMRWAFLKGAFWWQFNGGGTLDGGLPRAIGFRDRLQR